MSNFNRSTSGNYNKDLSVVSLFHGTKTMLLEDELNESQWTQIDRLASMMREQFTNGFIDNFTVNTTTFNNIFTLDSAGPISLLVDGFQLKIGHNTVVGQPAGVTSAENRVVVQLPAADATNRTDLVILEAWFEIMNSTETLRKFGGVDTPIINNTMMDERISKETSRRMQLRWRIRSIQNKSSIGSVSAFDYTGADSGVTFSNFDDIYAADLGAKNDASGNVKTSYPGRVYGLPLFSVTRTANNNTITLDNIKNLTSTSGLRVLDGGTF
jgi:hypothetical protein